MSLLFIPEPSVPAPPGVFVPKQERSTRTQAAILNAARAMISEGGIESLTISGVASRVGLTKGAFYARFRNKDALLHALFEETFEINRQAIDDLISRVQAADADLTEVITMFVPPALELVRESSALFRLFGSDHSGLQMIKTAPYCFSKVQSHKCAVSYTSTRTRSRIVNRTLARQCWSYWFREWSTGQCCSVNPIIPSFRPETMNSLPRSLSQHSATWD